MTFCEDEEQKNLVIKELAAFMTKSGQFSSCFMWKSVGTETDSRARKKGEHATASMVAGVPREITTLPRRESTSQHFGDFSCS